MILLDVIIDVDIDIDASAVMEWWVLVCLTCLPLVSSSELKASQMLEKEGSFEAEDFKFGCLVMADGNSGSMCLSLPGR